MFSIKKVNIFVDRIAYFNPTGDVVVSYIAFSKKSQINKQHD